MSETKLFIKNGESYEEVDGVLQKDFDAILESRVNRERAKFADYDALKKKADAADALKSDYDAKLKTATDRATELETQLTGAQLETERIKIIGEFKLKDELAEFVTGSNADEMRARAEKLAHSIPASSLKIDKEEKPEPKAGESATIAKGLFGGNSDD